MRSSTRKLLYMYIDKSMYMYKTDKRKKYGSADGVPHGQHFRAFCRGGFFFVISLVKTAPAWAPTIKETIQQRLERRFVPMKIEDINEVNISTSWGEEIKKG